MPCSVAGTSKVNKAIQVPRKKLQVPQINSGPCAHTGAEACHRRNWQAITCFICSIIFIRGPGCMVPPPPPPNSSGRFVAKGPVLQDVEAKIARLLVRDTGDGNEPGDGDRQPPTAKAVVAWIHQPPKVRRKNAFPQLCRLAPSVQTGQKQPGNDCGQGNFCWVKYWTKFNS